MHIEKVKQANNYLKRSLEIEAVNELLGINLIKNGKSLGRFNLPEKEAIQIVDMVDDEEVNKFKDPGNSHYNQKLQRQNLL